MRRWQTTPLPLLGSGGADTDTAVSELPPARVKVLRNALISGQGQIEHTQDWIATSLCHNEAIVTAAAVCGIYPFATTGNAPRLSAGVAFGLGFAADGILAINHVDQAGVVMRSKNILNPFPDPQPPQITGFEMFGKFYFCVYSPLGSGNLGLFVYDPSTNTVTRPTYSLAGGAAAVLKFRGISVHRGATILGWGYTNELGAFGPAVLRWSRYGAPDTWVGDTTDETAGFSEVGTLQIPLIACGMSGMFTILGKESEVYVMDGDRAATFNTTRQIAKAHGPCSTVGLAEITDAAVWMSRAGPAISIQGQKVELLTLDRVARRTLSYLNLETSWAVHDSVRHRVIWGVKRKEDDDGFAVQPNPFGPFLDELFWWDYLRHTFGAQSPPQPIFSLGVIRGSGLSLPTPTAAPGSLAVTTPVTDDQSLEWTWTVPDNDAAIEAQIRVNGTSDWGAILQLGTRTTKSQQTGLAPSTQYDFQVRENRNGQASAWTTLISAAATTLAAPTVTAPSTTMVGDARVIVLFGITYHGATAGWSGFGAGTTKTVDLLGLTTSGTPDPSTSPGASAPALAATLPDPSLRPVGSTMYYWVRTSAIRKSDGVTIHGTWTKVTNWPFTVP